MQIQNENSFLVHDLYSGNKKEIPAGKYFLNVRGGVLYLDDIKLGDKVRITRQEGGSLPLINQRQYNGEFTVTARAGYVYLNNEIDLEFFVSSVLPQKTSPIWPDEAIKAQALAAACVVFSAVMLFIGFKKTSKNKTETVEEEQTVSD